ncbi:MAG: TonB-dependent receptor [Nitrosomonas sp.]|nr:MAG: TonB-dependent receptor [Nitrosomonas sp.]
MFSSTQHVIAQSANRSLSNASLEELLGFEVVTASKIARQVSDAPSAVSIVTAADIKAYNYRTLADILSSMRGLNITYDRAYDFLGGRGYSSPGEYSGRIMLLIDGVQVNDNVFNQAYFGHDGLIDVELIERVEYIPGPGSVAYGNNAFFGIINIITKRGKQFGGAQAGISLGSFETGRGRITFGKQFENNVDLLMSASGLKSNGQNFYFPPFDDGNPVHQGGNARHLDEQDNQRLFGKLQGNNWLIEAGFGRRHKEVPTAPYTADFNSRYFYNDATKFIAGQYHTDLSDRIKLSLLADYSDYHHLANNLYAGQLWTEKAAGSRWSTEAKFAINWFDFHKLVLGIVYRDDFQRRQENPAFASNQGRRSFSLYVQNEFTVRDNLWLNLGVRYDHFTDDGDAASPRFALIYEPLPDHFIRLSHSQAHRTPTPFEKYYTDDRSIFANPGLGIEYVNASELVLERRWSNQSRVLATAYHQSTRNFINSIPYNPDFVQYRNIRGGQATGVELEAEHHWQNNIRLRASYAYQDSRNNDHHWAINSPHHLGKINLTAPLFAEKLFGAVEVQTVSSRKAFSNDIISGYTVTNVTLGTGRLLRNLHATFTVRNLFGTDYMHVAPDYNLPLAVIAQDERNFWLQLGYDFK